MFPITAGFLKENSRYLVDLYNRRIQEIETGQCRYAADSVLKSGMYSSYSRKRRNQQEALDYLERFPDDYVMHDGIGFGKEYTGYLAIVNRMR